MGKNNQQRRAAKRRARAAKVGPRSGTPRGSADHGSGSFAFEGEPTPAGPVGQEAEALALIQAAVAAIDDAFAFDNAVRDLVVFAGTVGPEQQEVAERAASRLLLIQVGASYERGWQPPDLVHLVRRESGSRLAKVAADVIVAQAIAERAPARAPDEWLSQLESVAERPLDGFPEPDKSWNIMQVPAFRRVGIWDAWHDVLVLLGHWLAITTMPALVPPPSSWGARRAAPAAPRGETGHDPKKLATIRALLAKAEATEFIEEADAFTAKA